MPDQDNDGMYKSHDGTKFLNESEAYNYTQDKMFGESDKANNSYLVDSFTSAIDAQGQAQRNRERAAEDARDRDNDNAAAASEMLEEADRLFKNEDFNGAVSLYINAYKTRSAEWVKKPIDEKADELFRRGKLDHSLQIYLATEQYAKAGYVYFKLGNKEKASELFKRKDHSDYVCAFRCGFYAEMGDFKKATEDCYNAIEQNSRAANEYGESGLSDLREMAGKEQVAQTFEKILNTAAEQGDKKAYITLEELFSFVHGMDDNAKTSLYNKKAREQGVKGTYSKLGYFYLDKGDYKKAKESFEKGIDAEGDAKCMYYLGRMHYFGDGEIPRDKKTGIGYIRKAARKGNKEAKRWLFNIFMLKLGFRGSFDHTGVGKTILFSLIFGGLSTLAVYMIITELLVGFPSIQAGFNQWKFFGVATAVSFFVVFWRHVPLIILLSLLSATGIFGFVHEVAKGSYFPESISSALIYGGGNTESGQKVKLTPRKVIENATVYAEPSTDSAVVKKLLKGTYINTTGKTADGWSPVEHFGDTGWINAGIVKGRGATVSIAKGDMVYANRRYIQADDTQAFVFCLATVTQPSDDRFARVTYYDGEKPTMDELMQVSFMQNYLNTHYAEGNPLLRMSGRLEILNFNETSAQVQYEDGRTATLPLSNIVFTKIKPK